ncbi:MAG: TIGR04552 family protein [Bdellovibrionaceae bacterium]|nr:TIGR04552 family protein [Pseudobdellovibrionaceae bacterium]NUM57767.1 TIGR04552 family protein [Pseudobdellovibrionaceae bacterium]
MEDLNLEFNWPILDTIAGGKSALDIPGLEIDSQTKATTFLKTYGFDCEKQKDIEKLWYYHRRSIVLMTEKLGYSLGDIPEELVDRKKLLDITKLLFYSSPKNHYSVELQKWSCALLRCIHVFVHAENDLFSSYSEDIQHQVLSDFQKFIYHDGQTHKILLTDIQNSQDASKESIELLHFQSKPFKTSSSTVIKLLARPDALAMKIFDRLGVRFVTKDIFDVFSVLRFLLDQHLISFPHTMPDQSSNNLFPVKLFMEAVQIMKENKMEKKDTQAFLKSFLRDHGSQYELLRKANDQTHSEFKFIKFITRKLIHIEKDGKRMFSFFFPYEVQIMDEEAYENMNSGPTSHDSYKKRQIDSAKIRLFSKNT